MADAPTLDGRRARELRRELAATAPYYAAEWDPEAGGVGAGLLSVFAELGAEVTERLDAAPAKHRVAFFDALGFTARPPQAARVPVQYSLVPEAPRNVAVRPGTAAVAAAEEEVTFTVGAADAFEATPARLTDVVAVDPDGDAVYDHGDVVDGAAPATPWTGADEQTHEWYVGDPDLLSAGGGDAVVLDVDADVDPAVLRERVEWHYYGEAADGSEGWQPLDATAPEVAAGDGDTRGVAVELSPQGPLVERLIDGVESKWLRCRLAPDDRPTGDLSFDVRSVGVTAGSSGSQPPDELLANDVPQETDPEGDEPVRPFGSRPHPGDAFYLAASAALSKAGARVTVGFEPADSGGESGNERGDGGEEARTDGGSDGDGDDWSVGRLSPAERKRLQEAIDELPPEAVERFPTEVLDQLGGGPSEPSESAPPDTGSAPSLSWEYWDGSAWSRLPGVDDGTEGFTSGERRTVTFAVPDDLAPTTVAGHEGHWIRVRLVGGDYGDVVHVPQSTEETRWVRRTTGSPPAFAAVDVAYRLTERRAPAHVRSHTALAATGHAPDGTHRPFRALPEAEQTLYLGFDAPLSGGPLQLFAAVDERPYPEGFAPRLRWERRHPDVDAWVRPTVRDDTAGLTEQGVLGVAFAEPTRATARFGRERHWLRARVTGDAFDPDGDADSGGTGTDAGGTGADTGGGDDVVGNGDRGVRFADGREAGLRACGAAVETAPPGGEPSEAPPRLAGLYMNVGVARNVREVEDETLGGSDGERGQTFAVANPPAVDVEVWVDESSALSEPQRERLLAERPDDVAVERAGDEVRAVWVRWREAPDLLDAAGDARRFAVDATAGEVRFGDGSRGRVPPRGANNVRASYHTGGGAAGNVPAGAVTDLESGLPFVEAVTNPVPGSGGADAESTEAVLERAPRRLRDRDRAVAPADYERLAADASRRVARATCIPAMDAVGDYDPGHVTVLVVPRGTAETPVPSVGLLDRVEESLGDHAPVSVVAGDRLVVRGPSYVGVGVAADVAASEGVGSLNAVEERLRVAVDDFLHPLSGRDGEGWPFGTLPTRSDVFALLEGVEGVDHVRSLTLTFAGRESVTVGEGAPQPDASADALVRGGDHDLTASLGGED